jgi:hypothetical protein
MTTKIVAFISLMTFATIAVAQPNYAALAAKLYPANQEDQVFTAKFFDLVEAHKTADPLLEGPGPSIREYSLDKIKFSLITNITGSNLDLVFFNWNLPIFQGLELDAELSNLYGSNVYTLKNVNQKSIASQGLNRSQLTNFSYMHGANYMERQILKGAPPGFKVPAEYLAWKPNPEYMDRSTPLRQTLGQNVLVILSPSKEVFFEGMGIPKESRPYMEANIKSVGGFQNMIMGTSVHEIFHAKEGEDQVNDLASRRQINEDRKEIVKQLEADAKLRSLMGTYVKIVFSIGDSLKNNSATAQELAQLSDLKVIINEIKSKHSETWKFIWNYEYTEGFAEYVSAYSMIQVGITTFDQKIDLEKADRSNNFAYRSGAIGGLYLTRRLQQMPFKNQEDHRESLWEIVLRLTSSEASNLTVDQVESKYANVPGVNGEEEVARVTEYLISTVMKIK